MSIKHVGLLEVELPVDADAKLEPPPASKRVGYVPYREAGARERQARNRVGMGGVENEGNDSVVIGGIEADGIEMEASNKVGNGCNKIGEVRVKGSDRDGLGGIKSGGTGSSKVDGKDANDPALSTPGRRTAETTESGHLMR